MRANMSGRDSPLRRPFRWALLGLSGSTREGFVRARAWERQPNLSGRAKTCGTWPDSARCAPATRHYRTTRNSQGSRGGRFRRFFCGFRFARTRAKMREDAGTCFRVAFISRCRSTRELTQRNPRGGRSSLRETDLKTAARRPLAASARGGRVDAQNGRTDAMG